MPTKRDPEGTRRRIQEAATEEFTNCGLSGARVDRIAKHAGTNERMLYYYYASKENLFVNILSNNLNAFIDAERKLNLSDTMPPTEAIKLLARFVWDYYFKHPEILSLINGENLHKACHLKELEIIKKGQKEEGDFPSSEEEKSVLPMVETLSKILKRGADEGVFRKNVDPKRFYITLSALGYYVVSNRYTLEAMMKRDFAEEKEYEELVKFNTNLLLSYLMDRNNN